MELLAPDLFWSNIVLGAATLACGLILIRHHRSGSLIFLSASTSAWLGAVYHGYIATTTTIIGRIIWLLVVAGLAISALALAQYSLGPRRLLAPLLAIAFGLYLAFAILVSDSILWVGVLEIGASILYGLSLFRSQNPAVLTYCSYCLVTIAACLVGGINPNPSSLTFFHLLSAVAATLLLWSMLLREPQPNPISHHEMDPTSPQQNL